MQKSVVNMAIEHFRHAEVLVNGELFVKSLRTAKATAAYVCLDGEQVYSPRLTYMGFRYVGVMGIQAENLELSALVLHSELEETGSFSCSNELINRLQENIRWSGKSNFVDIPTDCPQRMSVRAGQETLQFRQYSILQF